MGSIARRQIKSNAKTYANVNAGPDTDSDSDSAPTAYPESHANPDATAAAVEDIHSYRQGPVDLPSP